MSNLFHAARAGTAAGLRTMISRAFTTDEDFRLAIRDIQHIPGWFDETNASAFWAVIAERTPRTVVEIGSYLGRSTVFLGHTVTRFGPSDARVVSIDPHTGDRQQLEGLGFARTSTLDLFRFIVSAAGLQDRIDIRVATSDEAALDWTDEIDLLFVDGWHSYDAVRSDIAHWTPFLTRQGLVCFDDYLTYGDVHRAVNDGCADAGLTVYGCVLGQAWAGHDPEPPRSLSRGLRYARLRPMSIPA
jgi:predicted O-methyltransferase YrrM